MTRRVAFGIGMTAPADTQTNRDWMRAAYLRAFGIANLSDPFPQLDYVDGWWWIRQFPHVGGEITQRVRSTELLAMIDRLEARHPAPQTPADRATAASSPAPVSDCLTRLKAALPRLTQRRDRHGGVWIDQAELLAWIEGEMRG